MKGRVWLGLVAGFLVLQVSACGHGGSAAPGAATPTAADGHPESASALAVLAFRTVTGQLGVQATEPTDAQAGCMASRVRDHTGEERATELAALAATTSDMHGVAGRMHDPEVSALVDAILGCVDTASLLPGKSDLLPCLAPVFEGDGLRNLVRALITGLDYPTIQHFNEANNLCVLGGLVGQGG